MLVRDFIEVPAPLETVAAAVSDSAVWGRVLAEDLNPIDQSVLARFGMQGLLASRGMPMEVRIGRTTRHPRGTIIDVQWGHETFSGWDPVIQADATLSPLGANVVHLEFNGCYCGSGVLSSSPADRMMQHRVVEYAVRLILTRFADSLRPTGMSSRGSATNDTPTTLEV